MAAMQPDSAAVEPTDRSKPPPTMTKVMPMAITAMIEDCTRILVRLSGDRKRLVSSAVTAHSTISEISGIWPARLKRLVMGSMRQHQPACPGRAGALAHARAGIQGHEMRFRTNIALRESCAGSTQVG